MNRQFIRMVLLSVKRRRRSMGKIAVISFFCVFLFTGIMIFQDNMNRFQRENAFLESGEWIFATDGEAKCAREHAWIDASGSLISRAVCFSAPEDPDMAREEGYIGAVDQGFLSLSHLKMYSGKMPERDDEIAITQHVLSDMGYSYELGQQVTIKYTDGTFGPDGKPHFYEIEYKLCGIIQNYTAYWTEEIEELPEFITTEKGLDQITGMEDVPWYFYHADRGQRTLDGKKFYQSMKKLIERQEEDVFQVIYNEKPYETTMWGNRTIYLVIMTLCGLLGSMSLIYLFLMCCNSRRPWYFRLRELGAGSGQLRQMVCMEWSGVFLPSALLGIVISGILLTGVAVGIFHSFGIPYEFYMSGNSLIMIFAYTFGVFILVMLWSCLAFQVQGLHEMTGQIPLRRLKHMYRKGDAGREPVRLFLRRQNRMEPGKIMAKRLFGLVSMTIFLYSLSMIYSAYQSYQESEDRVDLSSSLLSEGGGGTGGEFLLKENKLVTKEIVSGIGKHLSSQQIDKGYSKEDVEQIENMPDIEQVTGIVEDQVHYLWWDGQEKSTFRQDWYIKTYVEDMAKGLLRELSYVTSEQWGVDSGADIEDAVAEYNTCYSVIPSDPLKNPDKEKNIGSIYQEVLLGVEQNEPLQRMLQKYFGKEFHPEEFWSGKQAILFEIQPQEPDEVIYEPGYLRYNDLELMLLQGEKVYDPETGEYRFQGKYGTDYAYAYQEDTVKNGDTIEIRKVTWEGQGEDRKAVPQKESGLETKVLLCQDLELLQKISSGVKPGGLGMLEIEGGTVLLSSESLMQKLADREETDCLYRTLSVGIKKGAAAKEVETRLADVLSRYECAFSSNVQDKKVVRQRFYRNLGMFGVVLILTGAVYLFICQSMQRRSLEMSQKRLRLLLQSGCSRQSLRKGYDTVNIRDALWGLAGIPLCLVVILVGEGISYARLCRQEMGELQIGEMLRLLWQKTLEFGSGVMVWCLFIGFLAVAVLLCSRAQWKVLREMELTEKEE